MAGSEKLELLRNLYQKLLAVLYPSRCPVCNRVLRDTLICKECAGKLRYVTQPFCYSCGKPVGSAEQEYCMDCMKKRHMFCQGRAVFLYQGAVRGMLYRYNTVTAGIIQSFLLRRRRAYTDSG